MQPAQALDILKKYWHYEAFRPLQGEIVESVLEGHDTLAILPTGGGKSVCYQVPALALEGLTLVVSPLIALMKDQVSQLRGRHIPAAGVYSGMKQGEIEAVLNNCIYGKTKLLYVSPERLLSRTFIDHMRQMRISLIAVDEAHCISQWGYDFRPPYLEIARLREYHPKARIIALTATATPEVATDIQKRLEFHNGNVFKGGFIRENLSYCVLNEENKQAALLRIINNVGGSGIVYTRNRRRTVETAQMLNDNGIHALAYHAGIDLRQRDIRQREWIGSHNTVMVATNAFGMGIDKPDVRFVIHLDIPESPEAYFQEAGRAGRDGKRAYAVLVYDKSDIGRLKESTERDFPPIQYIKNVYKAVCNYYQIPLGSGTDSRFEFKLEDICKNYGLDYYTFFSALKFIEREGLIALPEHSELQSSIFINIDKEELYRFQVNHRKEGDMLTTILRLYGGVFTDFTPISEALIGKRCGMTETQVINTLDEMERLEILIYHKRIIAPQIIFTSPRIDIKDLHISDRNYKDLKQSAIERRDAMLRYAANNSECRSRQLLAYFGETESHDCLCCDVCLKRKKKESSPVTLSEKILSLLHSCQMTPQELAAKLPDTDHDELGEEIRSLLERGEITINQGFLTKVSSSS